MQQPSIIGINKRHKQRQQLKDDKYNKRNRILDDNKNHKLGEYITLVCPSCQEENTVSNYEIKNSKWTCSACGKEW